MLDSEFFGLRCRCTDSREKNIIKHDSTTNCAISKPNDDHTNCMQTRNAAFKVKQVSLVLFLHDVKVTVYKIKSFKISKFVLLNPLVGYKQLSFQLVQAWHAYIRARH